MGNDDARSLDSQDTGGFAHPRGGQRAGGRKPLGCHAHFGCYRTDNVWLAGALPARRLGRFEGQTVIRPSADVERARGGGEHGNAKRCDRFGAARHHLCFGTPDGSGPNMSGPKAPLSPQESVTAMRRLIDTFGPNQSGKFYNYDGREYPW